jgi:hypothetical protein
MMTPRRPLALVLALALAGCGAEQLQPDQDARACSLAVQVEPGDPVAPTTVTARATVTGPSGVFTYTWTVRHDGAAVAVTPRTPDSRDIDFIATTAGVYDVTLDVDGAGPECTRWQGPVNVRDPGAMPGALRLRFAPAPTSGAPLQERTVIVPGGADFALGVLALDPGVVAPILVVDPGGQRVPSYVRLRSRATPDAVVELVTTAGGGERATLATGRYDVLVVPLVGGLAPAAIANWEPALGALTVGPGTPVTGHLQDETGAGLAGARIAIAGDDDGAPSTVATTASDGSFALAWQLGAGATLTVTPPAGSGRARLRVPLDQLAATRPLTIRYQPGHPIRDLTGTPTRIGGAAPPGGHALIAVELGAIATATDGLVTVDATGTHRDQVALDSAGRLTSYRLTAGAGRAYLVATDGGPGAVATFDATTATPAALAGATPRAVVATLTDRSGTPIAGAAVDATVTGDLAHPGAPHATATSAGDGRLTLALAAGASYELTIIDRRGARHRLPIGGVAVDLGAIALAPSSLVRGELRLVGMSVGLADAAVTALCASCTGLDRSRPLGETATDAAGTFTLAIPDPTPPP